MRKALALMTADYSSIPNTPYGSPGTIRSDPLGTETAINPENCWVWLQNKTNNIKQQKPNQPNEYHQQ